MVYDIYLCLAHQSRISSDKMSHQFCALCVGRVFFFCGIAASLTLFYLFQLQVIFHLVVVDLDDSAPEFVGALPSESSFGVQEADGDDANEGALLSPVIQVHDPDETQPSEFTFTLVKYGERGRKRGRKGS